MEKGKVLTTFQVGIVVNDAEEKLAKLQEVFEVDQAAVRIKSTADIAKDGGFTGSTYKGKPKEFYIKMAMAIVGNFEIQYMEPLNKEGGDPYSDYLKERGEGMYKLHMFFANRDEFIDLMENGLGKIPVNEGSIQGKGFKCYDLLDELGFVVETGTVLAGPCGEIYKKAYPEEHRKYVEGET